MGFQIKIIIFVAVTVGIVWALRSSLRSLRTHGLYRLVAWETILALGLLNIDTWFNSPFSLRQMVSWILLVACTAVGVHGTVFLLRYGKPEKKRDDPSLYTIEKTTKLVTVGAYRYIRHPLYCCFLLLAWGVFFKNPSWIGAALAVMASLFLTLTARTEEAENIRFFGTAYQDYMKRTKMFVPFLF